MGKMMGALLLIFAIEMAFFLFPIRGDPEVGTTSLFAMLTNPTTWASGAFLSSFLGIVSILGFAAIIVGSFITRNDWILRATLVATMITFGAVLAQLWIFVNAHFTYIGIDNAWIFASLITGPLLIYFLFTAVDFITGKD